MPSTPLRRSIVRSPGLGPWQSLVIRRECMPVVRTCLIGIVMNIYTGFLPIPAKQVVYTWPRREILVFEKIRASGMAVSSVVGLYIAFGGEPPGQGDSHAQSSRMNADALEAECPKLSAKIPNP